MILILNSSKSPLSPGSSIHSVLQEHCSSSLAAIEDTNDTYQDQLDRLFRAYRPKVVLNCHEYPDFDAAEHEREAAYEVNGFFLKTLSAFCRDRDAKLIHLSTSYVFNGSLSRPYREDDVPDPLSVYGDSKLLGERLVQESGCRYLILRIPDLFGEEMPLISRRVAMINDGGVLQVIQGQVAVPAYAGDLARAVSELISRDGQGLYHFSQGGAATAAEILTRALDLCGRYGAAEKNYFINEIEKEDFVAPGERPVYNVLDNGKLSRAAGISIRGWESALEEYISRNSGSIILT